ncbi:hypothetical protein KCV01_g14521, partial [Aureobasidium melanogenum]
MAVEPVAHRDGVDSARSNFHTIGKPNRFGTHRERLHTTRDNPGHEPLRHQSDEASFGSRDHGYTKSYQHADQRRHEGDVAGKRSGMRMNDRPAVRPVFDNQWGGGAALMLSHERDHRSEQSCDEQNHKQQNDKKQNNESHRISPYETGAVVSALGGKLENGRTSSSLDRAPALASPPGFTKREARGLANVPSRDAKGWSFGVAHSQVVKARVCISIPGYGGGPAALQRSRRVQHNRSSPMAWRGHNAKRGCRVVIDDRDPVGGGLSRQAHRDRHSEYQAAVHAPPQAVVPLRFHRNIPVPDAEAIRVFPVAHLMAPAGSQPTIDIRNQ